MQTKRIATIVTVVAALILLLAASYTVAGPPVEEGEFSVRAAPLGTSFTYQGRLTDGGSPANGAYDFEFELYDTASDGTLLGAVKVGDVTVTDGLFMVELDFGAGVFTGDARWLEIGVRPGGSTGAYTVLSPRQALTAAPYALYAQRVAEHDHLGQTWTGSDNPLVMSGSFGAPDYAPLVLGNSNSLGAGLRVDSAGSGVWVDSAGNDGLFVNSAGRHGVWVGGAGGHGVRVGWAGDDGVSVRSAGNPSTTSSSEDHNGFEVAGAEGHGLYVGRADQDGVYVSSAGDDGLHVEGASDNGVAVGIAMNNGMYVFSAGGDGVSVRSAGNPSAVSPSDSHDGFEVAGAEGRGLYVGRADDTGVYVGSAGWDGVYVGSAGDNGVRVDSADDHGVWVHWAGGDGVHVTSADGLAGYFGGDVHITGDVTCGGPNTAAFPRPAYDSGWQVIDAGTQITFTHNIGGNVDNYVVDLQFRTSESYDNPSGIHTYGFGGLRLEDTEGLLHLSGGYWHSLTTSSIIVWRDYHDFDIRQVRIRIWVYP